MNDHFGVELVRTDHTALVVLRGEIDLEATTALNAALAEAMAGERVIVDLSRTSFIDSTGVGALAMASRAAADAGTTLTVVRGPSKVMNILRMSGAYDLLTFVDNGPPADAD
jgi:anti-sigma B factor antagonist